MTTVYLNHVFLWSVDLLWCAQNDDAARFALVLLSFCQTFNLLIKEKEKKEVVEEQTLPRQSWKSHKDQKMQGESWKSQRSEDAGRIMEESQRSEDTRRIM